MKNIVLFSGFLIIGLIFSQLLPSFIPSDSYDLFSHIVKLFTTIALGFIMIRVGYEFDLDKSRLKSYGWDYIVAATAAALPWVLVALYFVFILSGVHDFNTWKESLLASRFASPTSAGVLFAMLAAAGLGSTWMYQKIKILAIFDDLDTVLLMIPLQILLIGWKWQLAIVAVPMFIFLWVAWRYLHRIHIPITWSWTIGYSISITLISEIIYYSSRLIDEVVPVHIEVLLPAFVIGCIIARNSTTINNTGVNPHEDIIDRPNEKQATLIVSTVFMLLVGLSMPAVVDIAGSTGKITIEELNTIDQQLVNAYIPDGYQKTEIPSALLPGKSLNLETLPMSWGWITIHVIIVTLLSNIGKLFPLFCYQKEAHWKERLALSVGMFPRGEVGAGVLIISVSYGIGGAMITVAMLSLALNLILTGVFIVIVKALLNNVEGMAIA